ncbi:MAG: hypothetical protein JWL65_5317 [Gammaproteobacteria bacterium]|nr:hypothetical protein [Gammaproteobacteria bacterium]
MNAVSNECVSVEVDAEVTNETDAGLVEVGAVSGTKGGPVGFTHDLGNGWIFG